MTRIRLFVLPALSLVWTAFQAQAVTPIFAEEFEDGTLGCWSVTGEVSVEPGDAFRGQKALVLRKSEAALKDGANAVSPPFAVKQGLAEITFATKSDLTSMDNSYNGTINLEFFDSNGKGLETTELGSWFRQNQWKKNAVQVSVPDEASSARLVASLNKETPGTFSVDDIAVRVIPGGIRSDGLRRMTFDFKILGHLLFPDDDRRVQIEVWSARELPEGLRTVTCSVRDFWGAEQAQAIDARLEPAGQVPGKQLWRYAVTVDLSAIPLEVGRYYEFHGEISSPDEESFRNHTSFAILPEAPANRLPPGEVPFSSRTWDQRFPESPLLTHRLGIRICNVWGRMDPDAEKLEADQIDLVHQLGMGVLTSSPAQRIEARRADWRDLLAQDGALLRQGVRNFFKKYGHIKPMIVNLGNEPHSKGEGIKIDVAAYRIVYQEIKKIDPAILVVGTSVGPEEEYFRAGFGEWCDAYDFHSYEDPEGVRTILLERYPELFRKYGFPKPIWCTEIGMNSQGMSRLAVASLVYKKFANFFAAGGTNISWFGLFYPDPEGTAGESFASAHNVFDCRFNKFAPKLDAIAYYNAVNGISNKKFVEEKSYAGGEKLFLFRDAEHRTLIIAYADKVRRDVTLRVPGVKSVEMVRIDGSRNVLKPSDGMVATTFGPEPILLQFEGGSIGLPQEVPSAPVRFVSLPSAMELQTENIVKIATDGVDPELIQLHAPPLWVVERRKALENECHFALQAPKSTEAREIQVSLSWGKDGPSGLLSTTVPVKETLSFDVFPVATAPGKLPGAKLIFKNNRSELQKVSWQILLTGEQMLHAGTFSSIGATNAEFSVPTSGTLDLKGHSSSEVILPLADCDKNAVYHLKATFRDQSGDVRSRERTIAGFVPVHKAAAPVKIDGNFDDKSWTAAPEQVLSDRKQFFGLALAGKPAPVWEGPDDLSASIRYLWDEKHLYIGATVKDNVAAIPLFRDEYLWRVDGVQMLVDPRRESSVKPGKYEYIFASGEAGPQAWCVLSADPGVVTGEAKDISLGIKRDGSGNLNFEIAIPWTRLAPFEPFSGANLGLTLLFNDDDGEGRNGFMTWFGNAHTKDIDTVGDLILQP